MSKTYTLKRVIPKNECPGTCCKAVAGPPFPNETNSDCKHFDPDFPGRPFGGCPFFDKARREATLTAGEIDVFNKACVALPYHQVNIVRSKEEHHHDHKFVLADGTKWCNCWEWRPSDGS